MVVVLEEVPHIRTPISGISVAQIDVRDHHVDAARAHLLVQSGWRRSGLGSSCAAYRFGALLFRHGEHFYNFRGLRALILEEGGAA